MNKKKSGSDNKLTVHRKKLVIAGSLEAAKLKIHETRIQKAREALENDKNMREDAKRLALAEVMGSRPESEARDMATEWIDSHGLNTSDPRYAPESATFIGAVAVAHYLDKEAGTETLKLGPKASAKARTKATDRNVKVWREYAKKHWAIEMRENGGHKVTSIVQMAEIIARHPVVNKIRASAGTIKNNITAIKARVIKPAAEGEELET